MPSKVHVNFRTVVHKTSGDKSFAFPDVCKTPAAPSPIPIPYPNFGQSTDAAKCANSVKADGQPIMVKDSYYRMSTGDEAGTAGGNVVTNKIKGKCYFIMYSFDVKAEGKNVVRFLDPMTHNHSCPPPGTPPGPDVGGTIATPTQVDIDRKLIVGKVIKVEFQSGIPLESKGIKTADYPNPYPAGDLPASGQPHWDYSKKDAKDRSPAVYAIEGGGSSKKLRVELEITDLENVSGEAELEGRYMELKIKAKTKVSLKKGTTGWIDCEFEELPKKTRYVPSAGIQWTLTVGGDSFPLNETKVKLFFIFAEAKKPFNGKKLWFEALEYAFNYLAAGYLGKSADILTNLTRGLHGCGLKYDTESGAALCGWFPPTETNFALTTFLKEALNSASNKRVNCYDMSGTVICFSSLLGVADVKSKFLGFPLGSFSYGFIKATLLVGIKKLCNCPFYESADAEVMAMIATLPPAAKKNAMNVLEFGPIKSQDYTYRSSFANHAFPVLGRQGKKAYDACAGPYTGSGDWKQYTRDTIDTKRSSKEWTGWTLKVMWNDRVFSIDSVS